VKTERMDPAKAAPFEIGDGRDAVLLVHGFTGSPWDMRPLGEALADQGYYARGIRLPGHGLSPEAMLGVNWRDWERAIFDAVADLHTYKRVFVAGLSMGALLAVILAAREPERVRALALLAPAVRFQSRTLAAFRALRSVPMLHLARPWIQKDATDIADPNVLADAPILARWPSQRLWDLWRVQDRALARAAQVRCPTLVAVARNDHVVAAGGGEELARRLVGVTGLRFVRIDEGFHIMPRDFGKDRVSREVIDFFEPWRTK
jgi:carboxylesterase